MAIGPVKKIEADVRFFVNGEQYGETQTIEVGKSATEPTAPTVPSEDMIFVGWRPIGGENVIEVGSMIVVSDVDYEAVFEKLIHEVVFMSRDAVYTTQMVAHGTLVDAPQNPEVKGFEFLCWSLTDGGTAVKLNTLKITQNTTLYAVFLKEGGGGGGGAPGGAPTEESFKVKFYVNGDLHDSQTLVKNSRPALPEDPEVEGYEFLGWSESKNGAIVDPTSYKVTKALTFYAVFEEEPEPEPEVYTVTFYADGKVVNTQYVTDGECAEEPRSPSKNGYIFKYWSKTENGSEAKVGYVKITSNTDFYAVFEEEEEEINYFTVLFMVDGREYSSNKVEEGKKASAPSAPSKEGYTFKGWSKEENGSVSSVSVTVTEDITFYAVFEKIEYTVTFYVDGVKKDTQKVGVNESASVPSNPSKEGYIFKGWSETEDGTVVNVGNIVITSNMSFYAVFEKKEPEKKTFEIKFVVDGKSYDSKEVVEGDSFDVPDDPKKADHNFIGWAKSENGSVVSVATKPTSNATYYAVFEEIKKYTVIFYVNGTKFKTVTVVDGEYASAPSNPSVEGYTFKGWSETDGGEVVAVGSVKITANTNFYAVLEEKEPEKVYFTVTFKADGANHDVQQVLQGETAVAPKDPVKQGYEFLGWSRMNGGPVVDVSSVTITKSIVFYAKFQIIETDDDDDEEDDGGDNGGGTGGGPGGSVPEAPKVYTVTFYVDGEVYDEQEVESGDYPEEPKDPKLDGYEFLGWATSSGSTTTVYPDSIKVEKNLKYYAVFEKEEEEVVYYNVIFWFNGEPLKKYEVAAGDTVKAPTTPKLEEGESFLGWSLKDNNSANEIIDVSDIIIEGHTDFYSVIISNPNDEELMEKLDRGYKQLGKIKADGRIKTAITKIRTCVGKIIDDANGGIYITKNYVKKEYASDIAEVSDIVNNRMTSTERSNFVNLVTNPDRIDQDVQDFLIDYFDIDTSI